MILIYEISAEAAKLINDIQRLCLGYPNPDGFYPGGTQWGHPRLPKPHQAHRPPKELRHSGIQI